MYGEPSKQRQKSGSNSRPPSNSSATSLQKKRVQAQESAPVKQPEAEQPTTMKQPNELVNSFSAGDKLYGIKLERPQDAVKEKADGQAVVMDQINNEFLGTKGVGLTSRTMGAIAKKKPNEQDSHSWKEQATYGKNATGVAADSLTPEASEYKNWLEQHRKYSPTTKQVRGEKLSSPFRQFDRVKKSCKAAIEYAVMNKKKIHFVLDGIDLEAVIHKQDAITKEPQIKIDPVTDDSSKQSITAAELRFVYRNWNDPIFAKGVKFWQGGKEVEAPWKQDPKSWSHYSPKSKQPSTETGTEGVQSQTTGLGLQGSENRPEQDTITENPSPGTGQHQPITQTPIEQPPKKTKGKGVRNVLKSCFGRR